MNRTSPSEVKAWCISRGFHPNKTLGQNFLIDANILNVLAEATACGEGDAVLEVGPGLGVLTEALLKRGVKLSAIEKDPALAKWLESSLLQEYPETFHLTLADALETAWDEVLQAGHFKAFASNLPYSVGTRILVDLTASAYAPDRLVTLVQKEVADRFIAQPSTPQRSTASIWFQLDYDIRIVKLVKPTCFWPPPEVTSAIVLMERHQRSMLTHAEKMTTRALAKHLFLHRRKQLKALLRNAPAPFNRLDLDALGIDPMRRPETLSIPEWEQMGKCVHNYLRQKD